jgi:hypothetical protein
MKADRTPEIPGPPQKQAEEAWSMMPSSSALWVVESAVFASGRDSLRKI